MKHPYEDHLFLLVSGQARSGTTVLTRALAKHPQIESNGRESNFIRDLILVIKQHTQPAHRLTQLSVSYEQFVLEFRRAVLNSLFPVEKLPSESPRVVSTFSSLMPECQSHLRDFFPKLLLVNIVRNGLEVVASRMAHEHIGKYSFEEHCLAWKAAIDMPQWGADRDDFFLVRHEDLRIQEKREEVFNRIHVRAGLDPSPLPSQFVGRGVINTTQYEHEKGEDTNNLATRIERWRNWTPEQREMFDRICRPGMEFFGYPMPW